ncbi:MAG: AMP-binding enzyme [Bacillota bacterium]
MVLKEGMEATAEEISEFCRENMASYKVPRYIEFVTELPKNATGKILKHELKKRAN